MHKMRQKEASMKVKRDFWENICSTLCQVLSPEDYSNIMRVTDTSKDAEYQRSKRHLKKVLTNEKWKTETFTDRMIMKPAVSNLTSKNIDKNVTSLLNFEPNFIPAPKSIPYIEIITVIESQALNLVSGKKDTTAENLPDY